MIELSCHIMALACVGIAWNQAPHWGKKEEKIGSASKASREVIWGGERVATAGLASFADFFLLFDPVFCLFPPL